MVCPNYNSPEWKMASSLLGEDEAYALFILNDSNLPDLGTIKKMALSKALKETYLNSSQLMGIADINSFFNFINEKYKDKEIMIVFRPEKVKDEPYSQGTTYFGTFAQAVKYSNNSKVNTFVYSKEDNKLIGLDFQQDTEDINTLRGYETKYLINDIGDNTISVITTQDPVYQQDTDSIFVVTKGKPQIDNLNSESLVEEFIKFTNPEIKTEEVVPSSPKFSLKDKGTIADFIYNNLRREGIIHKYKNEIYITGSRPGERIYSDSYARYNTKRMRNYLSANAIPQQFISEFSSGSGVVVNFSSQLDTKVDSIHFEKQAKAASNIIAHLSLVFPQVKVKAITVGEAKLMLGSLAKQYKLDDSEVKGFYYNGTSYLLKGRYDSDTAAEEMLHPFVDALMKDNPELFSNLFIEAKKAYPALFQEIQSTYSNARGFTELDRTIEFVTQSLSKTFVRGFDEKLQTSWKDQLNKFKSWIVDFLNKLYGLLTGNKLKLSVKDLRPNMRISDVLNLIHSTDLFFNFNDLQDNQIRFSLTPEKVEALKKNATEEQKVVIDKLANQEPKVILDEESHVYLDEEQNIYKSVTTGIKGKLYEELGENEISRLVGKDFDKIVEDIINGKLFDEIAPAEVKNNTLVRNFFTQMSEYITSLQADGSVILAQVVVADPNRVYYLEEDRYPIAGSIDILVISPEGIAKVIDLKVSKNATVVTTPDGKVVDSPNYLTQYPVKKRQAKDTEDPKLINTDLQPGVKLSTKTQHGIQVNTYSKLLEVMGIPTQTPTTINIKLDGEFFFVKDGVKYAEMFDKDGNKIFTKNNVEIEGNEYIKAREEYLKADSTNKLKADIKDLVWEIERPHTVSDNQVYVNQLVLSKRAVNDFKDSINAEKAEVQEEAEDTVNRIISFLTDFVSPALESRIEVLKKLSGGSGVFKPKINTIDKLGTLVNLIKEEVKVRPVQTFGRFLRDVTDDINAFAEWMQDENNLNKPTAASVVINFGKFLNTYNGLKDFVNTLENNPDQQRMLRDTLNLLNEQGNPLYKQGLQEVVKNLIKNNTNYELTDDDLNSIVSTDDEFIKEDISIADFNFGDIDTSPNELLALAARLYKQGVLKVEEATDAAIEEARIYANALATAQGGKPDYSFMVNPDGTYVRKIGKQYYEIANKLYRALEDSNGKRLQYIEGDQLTQEEIDFNIDLYNKRKALSDFLAAEVYENKKLEPGKYHKYTQEFLEARAKHEVFKNGQWVPRSDMSTLEIAKYRAKYFNRVEYNKMIKSKGVPTGIVSNDTEVGYFVKKEYKEIREKTTDGQSMLNPRYEAIINDNSTLGVARKNFYDFWIREHDQGSLSKLSEDVRRQMKGTLPLIQSRFSEKLAQKPQSVGTLTLKSLRNFFNFKTQRANSTIIREIQTDETGDTALRRVPVYYVGSFKNEERIKTLKEEKDKLIADFRTQAKTKQSLKEYKEKLAAVDAQLTLEENKLTPEEVNTDLFESFVMFRRMAENFEKMSAVEDSLLAIDSLLKEKKYASNPNEYVKKIKSINPSAQIRYADGTIQSRVSQRLDKFLDMVFYSTSKYQKSSLQYGTEKLMAMMSFQYVGLNIFGNLHNFIFGKISNSIETIGGKFYDRRAAVRAQNESIKFLAGYSKKAFSSKDGYYNEKKAESKYEAVVSYFRMIRDKDSGLSYDYFPSLAKLSKIPYAGQKAGEYMLQSKTGIAYVMSRQIVNSKTGETKALYDAFKFNPNTGKLELQDGFEFTERDKFDVTNYIWEMNKEIHGNYAWEDRMVIQDVFLGQLVAQFHKWVYPAYKARFKKRYTDANLGDMEGRYRSLWEFIKYLKETRFTGFKESWELLDDVQKTNMMRNLGEASWMAMSFVLFTILSKLSEGEDDEDVKKLINVFAYDFNRTSKELLTWVPVIGTPELYQMVKNPVAVTRYLGEISDVIEKTTAYPFQEADERIYQRGIHKDELKLKKELFDVIPIVYQIQRWDAYANTKNFYIK
jgi:hypothetical protein